MAIDIDDFKDFVKKAHAGQPRFGRDGYHTHLYSVADRTAAIIRTLPVGMLSDDEAHDAALVALGHDLFEDHEYTKTGRAELLAMGGTPFICDRIEEVSRMGDPKPRYQSWIEDLAANGHLISLIVKIADNRDNNDPASIAALPPERRSISRRYDRAYAVLRHELERRVAAFKESNEATSSAAPRT